MAKFEYRFPELGEGLHEGEIVKMHIKPGRAVTTKILLWKFRMTKRSLKYLVRLTAKYLKCL